MFQYEFFSLKDFRPHLPPRGKLPATFIRPEQIAWIRSSYWSEHCLECGEPECYETCPNFKPRADERCRLFCYGIHSSPFFKDAFYRAQLKFRKWGKLETTLYPGSFTPEKALRIHNEWKEKSLEKCKIMHQGKRGLEKFSVEERRKFDSSKYGFSKYEDAHNVQDTPWFLVQIYSYERKPFLLFLDITDDADLAFRESILVQPGYNQQCLDIRSIFPQKGRLRAKFYPADNAEAELVFLFCECVQLKPGVASQPYPAPGLSAAPKVKCVAWDLDHTIWDGILMESDPLTLTLKPGILDLIEQLDQRGILQIVLSKNNREDVLPVLQRLGIDQFFVHVLADWNSKSQNLRQAASLLNLGIDSFALIDDSAFERHEVSHAFPTIRVYSDLDATADLLSRSEFCVPITEESRNRRKMYQTELQRQSAAAAEPGNVLKFLRSCQLTARLSAPASEEELLRSWELLQRTNQLNLSGNRYEQGEFRSRVSDSNRICRILKCEDRFGSYGQVVYLEGALQNGGRILQISEFAMSCRVAGKYIEPALMDALFQTFGPDLQTIELTGRKTDRNGLLMQSFLHCGFRDEGDSTAIHLLCNRDDLLHTDIVRIVIQ